MANKIRFKKGLKINLPDTGEDDKTLYFTTDTGEIYLSAGDGVSLEKIGIVDAIDIPYDNTISGLTATNVKNAIDELKSLITT